MFEKIRGFFMNILNLFKHGESVEQVTGINTNISATMYEKIREWGDIMTGNAPWNAKAPSCGIPDQVADLLNYFISREIGVDTQNEAIKPVMDLLNKNVDKLVEYMADIGGALVRPIFANNKLQFEALPLGNYLPTHYDFDGTLLGAIVLKNIISEGKPYLLVESHEYREGSHFVSCKLYKNDNTVLKPVGLDYIQETRGLTPEYVWRNVPRPMIIEFRNHAVNKIDGSNVPVSLLSGCEDLIREADEQWERMNWEQKGGEMRVFADREMFRPKKVCGADGKAVQVATPMSKELNRLVVQIDGDELGENGKIHEFAPNLRTTAQNEMLQQIFRRIELTLNIGKGSISDMESVTQTATQYTGGRQGLFAIVDYFEDEIADKYKDCAVVFAHIASAYGLGANDATIEIKWNDDKTRKDITAAKQMALQEIAQGVRAPWEYRRDFMGEDEATAKANTPQQTAAPNIDDVFNFA